MRKTYVTIIVFGSALAMLAFILQLFEYKYLVGRLSTDIYTAVVATLFTVVGIWIGINILRNKHTGKHKNPIFDFSKKEELNLNEREFEILIFISQGYSNQEIADKLFLALPTIKTHISNLYSKLDVKSRTQAVHRAKSLNLI